MSSFSLTDKLSVAGMCMPTGLCRNTCHIVRHDVISGQLSYCVCTFLEWMIFSWYELCRYRSYETLLWENMSQYKEVLRGAPGGHSYCHWSQLFIAQWVRASCIGNTTWTGQVHCKCLVCIKNVVVCYSCDNESALSIDSAGSKSVCERTQNHCTFSLSEWTATLANSYHRSLSIALRQLGHSCIISP